VLFSQATFTPRPFQASPQFVERKT